MADVLYLITTLGVRLADDVVVPDPTTHTGTGIDRAQILALLIGFVIPVLVALVTKHQDKPRNKALLLLLLNALNGFLTEMLVAQDFVWQQALFGALVSFMMSVATFFGLWKPTGVDDAAKNVLRSSDMHKNPNNQSGAVATNLGLGIVLVIVGLVLMLFVHFLVGLVVLIIGILVAAFGGRYVA